MLGEQYAELKGKITSQRVLDVEGPVIETSVLSTATMRGIQVQEMVTFTGTPTSEKGVFHTQGKGVVMTTMTTAARGGGDSTLVTETT